MFVLDQIVTRLRFVVLVTPRLQPHNRTQDADRLATSGTSTSGLDRYGVQEGPVLLVRNLRF
jgi:hypothetical protein